MQVQVFRVLLMQGKKGTQFGTVPVLGGIYTFKALYLQVRGILVSFYRRGLKRWILTS